MGITLEQYRASIGLNNKLKLKTSLRCYRSMNSFMINILELIFLIFYATLDPQCLIYNLTLLTSGVFMILRIPLFTFMVKYVNFFLLFFIILHFIPFFDLLCLCGDIESNPGPTLGNLTFSHTNVQSLFAYDKMDKFNEINDLVDELSLDIIALSETWLPKKKINDNDMLIPNFCKPYRHDRPVTTAGTGGGVMVYVSDSLAHWRLNQLEIVSRHFESVWLKIRTKDYVILFAVYYRPPDDRLATVQHFCTCFDQTLSDALKIDHDILIITGDFNAKNKEWYRDGITNTCGRHLFNVLFDHNLSQLIQDPTHYGNGEPSCIDLIITNSPNQFILYGPGLPLTGGHHCTMIGQIIVDDFKQKKFDRDLWFYNQIDDENFHRIFTNSPWNSCFELYDDVNDMYEYWSNLLKKNLEKCIPHKTVKVFPNNKNWFTKEHHRFKKKVNRLYRKARRTKSINDWNTYKNQRNQYTLLCRNSKENYENKLLETLENSNEINKKWWNVSKKLMGKKVVHFMPPLFDNDEVLTDNKDKANLMNMYFTSISTVDSAGKQVPNDILEHPQNLIEHVSCAPEQVKSIIKNLDQNKASGHDNISARMLKLSSSYICDSLCSLINRSLTLGRFPDSLKKANVTPLFKQGHKNDKGNYRPISILPSISKIFERIVYIKLYEFLSESNFFVNFQSGFRANDSTVNQLIDISHLIYRKLKNNEEVIGIYLDISKAFDKVWHQGLIYKLKKAGIRGRLLLWLTDYLTNRQQRVIIGGSNSEWANIEAGVPQGSILGPLLFLIFINDIANDLESVPHLFADDTNILFPTKDMQLGIATVNRDLMKISSWCDKWCVTMNPGKIKAILYSRKRNPSQINGLTYNNSPVKIVTSLKHLGLQFDSQLNWNEHIDLVIEKARGAAHPIHLLKYKISTKRLLFFYKVYIRPIIEYGCVIWGNNSAKFLLLERIQYQIARSITGAMKNSSSSKLNNILGIPSLETRCRYLTVNIIRKIYHHESPVYLNNVLQHYRPNNRYARDNQRLNATGSLYQSFFERGIKTWNSLTQELRGIQNNSFKNKVFSHWNISLSFKCSSTIINRNTEINLNRILVEFSQLHGDLFTHNVIPDNKCICNTRSVESRQHYFFECTNFIGIRANLLNDLIIYEIIPPNHNFSSKRIFQTVHRSLISDKCNNRNNLLLSLQNFIIQSNRFQRN